MKSEVREQDGYTERAILVGEKIIQEGKQSNRKSEIFWKIRIRNTNSLIKYSNVAFCDLYSGGSGISLFYINLYRRTKEPKFLLVAEDSMRWVFRNYKNRYRNNYALYTGRIGIAYVFIELFKETGREEFIAKAKELAIGCDEFLVSSESCDLLNGISGTVLGLLQLYNCIREKWILDLIIKGAHILIERAIPGPRGLYWNYSKEYKHGLCGLSHGVSGIGLTFLELGKFFNSKTYFLIAEQAFQYELYYQNKLDYYPDFRIITKPLSFVPSWCNGICGASLAQIRACELLNENKKNDFVKSSYEKLLNYIKSTVRIDNGICHGLSGYGMFFLEGYKRYGDERYKTFAREIGQTLWTSKLGRLENRSSVNKDSSLFNGMAGIALFFLQLAKPNKLDSLVFFPQISNSKPLRLQESDHDAIMIQLLEKAYPLTINNIDEDFKNEVYDKIKPEKCIYSQFQEIVSSGFVFNQSGHEIERVYNIELNAKKLSDSIKDEYSLHQIQKEVVAENRSIINNLRRDRYKDKLILSPLCKVQLSKIDVDTNSYHLIVLINRPYVKTYKIEEFQYLLLKRYILPTSVESTLNEVEEEFISKNKMAISIKKIQEQITKFLEASILISYSSYLKLTPLFK